MGSKSAWKRWNARVSNRLRARACELATMASHALWDAANGSLKNIPLTEGLSNACLPRSPGFQKSGLAKGISLGGFSCVTIFDLRHVLFWNNFVTRVCEPWF